MKAGGWSPSVFFFIANCKLKNRKVQNANSKMQIANWKMDFAIWKLKILAPRVWNTLVI
jgi:hypothetical protein